MNSIAILPGKIEFPHLFMHSFTILPSVFYTHTDAHTQHTFENFMSMLNFVEPGDTILVISLN